LNCACWWTAPQTLFTATSWWRHPSRSEH